MQVPKVLSRWTTLISHYLGVVRQKKEAQDTLRLVACLVLLIRVGWTLQPRTPFVWSLGRGNHGQRGLKREVQHRL